MRIASKLTKQAYFNFFGKVGSSRNKLYDFRINYNYLVPLGLLYFYAKENNMRFYSTILLLLVCRMVQAQFSPPDRAGAHATALGYSSLTLNNAYSSLGNEAMMAQVKTFSVGLNAERRFLNSALNDFLLCAVVPSKLGAFGLHVQHFGYSNFNQQSVGVAYARKLFKQLSIGVKFNYFATRFGDATYPVIHRGSFSVGLYSPISKRLSLAAHVFSPAQIEISEGDRIPTLFRFGANWAASSKISIIAEAYKDLLNPAGVRGGFEYRPLDQWAIRAGFMSYPFSLSMGMGLRIKQIRLDVAASWQQILGVTPSLGLSYVLNEK